MVEESVATGSLRPVSTSGNGCAESSLFVVLSMWMRKWVYLRFLVKVVIVPNLTMSSLLFHGIYNVRRQKM